MVSIDENCFKPLTRITLVLTWKLLVEGGNMFRFKPLTRITLVLTSSLLPTASCHRRQCFKPLTRITLVLTQIISFLILSVVYVFQTAYANYPRSDSWLG